MSVRSSIDFVVAITRNDRRTGGPS
jgi:hypothetical protein